LKKSTQSTKKVEKITVEPKKKRGARPSSEPVFPVHSLKESLGVIQAMEKNYEGDPTDPVDIADILKTTLNSKPFRNLLSSSHRYGLSTGSYKSEKIEMTELGKSIMEFTSDKGKNQGLMNSLLRPKVFKNILKKYDRRDFPREQIIKNVLKNDFGVPHDKTSICAEVIIANVTDFGLIHEKTGMLRMSQLSTPKLETDTTKELDVKELENDEDEDNEFEDDEVENNVEIQPEITQSEKIQSPKVFISHSKNKKILEQLEKMLKIAKMEYKLAKDTPEKATFLLTKVFGLLKECNCAIINISADDEGKKENGEYGINENVLIEIGASYGYFRENIILLVDNRIKLPSMLEGVHVCKYNGDELSFDNSLELQQTINLFKN